MDAAIYNETDYMRSVSENIIFGQLVPIGTGSFDVHMDDKANDASSSGVCALDHATVVLPSKHNREETFGINSPAPYHMDVESVCADTPHEDHGDLLPTTGGTYQNPQSVEVSPRASSPAMRHLSHFGTPSVLATPGSRYTPHGTDLTPFSFSGASTVSPAYSPADKKEEDEKDDEPYTAYSPGASAYSGAKTAYTMPSARYTPTYTPHSVYGSKSVGYTPSAVSPFSHKSPGYTPMSSRYGATPTHMRSPDSPRTGGPTPGYSPSIAPSIAPSSARGASPIIQEHQGPTETGADEGASPSYSPPQYQVGMPPEPASAVYSADTDFRPEDPIFDDDEDMLDPEGEE